MRLTDPRFRYRSSQNTDIRDTWRKHGFKPMTDAERKERQLRLHDEAPKNVTPISGKRAKAGK